MQYRAKSQLAGVPGVLLPAAPFTRSAAVLPWHDDALRAAHGRFDIDEIWMSSVGQQAGVYNGRHLGLE